MKPPVRVEISQEGDGIELASRYYPDAPGDARAVGGGRWDKEAKLWKYPLSLETCRSLRRVYGDRLNIGPRLWVWAQAANNTERAALHLGRADDAELRETARIAPKMHAAMLNRRYQRAGARFLYEVKRGGTFDEMGLGKTVMSLSAIMENGTWEDGHHLIICPKTAMEATWAEQIRNWTDGTPFIMNGSADRRRKILDDYMNHQGPALLIANPEMLQVKVEKWCRKCKEWEEDLDENTTPEHWLQGHKVEGRDRMVRFQELLDIEWNAIIADEAHRYLLRVRPRITSPQWAVGLARLKSAEDGLRIVATGTPFRGRERNMFGMVYWSDPKSETSYWAWVDRYLEKDDVLDRSGRKLGTNVGGLRPDAEEAFYKSIDVRFLRRTRHEVRADLPTNNQIDVWVQMLPKQRKQYEQWAAEGIARIDGGSIESLGLLAELTRARQFAYGAWRKEGDTILPLSADSPKAQHLLDMLDERGISADQQPLSEGVDKIIVVSQFTRIIDDLYDMLEQKGIPALRITGAHKGDAAKRFNAAGGPRVLLLNTQTGGVSLTLDAFCDEMVFLDETFVHDDQAQAMGRIDNRGTRTAPRFFYFIRTRDTIEERISEMNIGQDSMQTMILDGRRGVKIARQLMHSERA